MAFSIYYSCCDDAIICPNSVFDDVPDAAEEDYDSIAHAYTDMIHAIDHPECGGFGETFVTC